MRSRVLTRGLGAIAAATCLSPAAAQAATLTVDTTDETSATNCTLGEAITSANGNADAGCTASGPYGNDIINITATGTINRTGPLPAISSNVDINGPGAGQLDIHRQSGGDYRVLSITGGGDAQISGVTVSNGRLTALGAQGAGIQNAGFLLLEDSVVRDSQVSVAADVGGSSAGGGGVSNIAARRSPTTSPAATSSRRPGPPTPRRRAAASTTAGTSRSSGARSTTTG